MALRPFMIRFSLIFSVGGFCPGHEEIFSLVKNGALDLDDHLTIRFRCKMTNRTSM